ncbi:calcium-binding protein [Streptomyces sp. AF1A]|jgi:hypothetical protein|uniref:calcium-binding protein n=1 Tax=Streptomyces sp. AF1A TaxID=3394350 RepID=UPI0039BC78F6
MRTLAIGAALSGALALTALVVPSAQADEIWDGGVTITDVTVNGGKPIVVGTTNTVTFTGSVTATDPDGIQIAAFTVVHGSGEDDPDLVSLAPAGNKHTCAAVDATTTTCGETITVNPHDLTKNAYAGAWNVSVFAFDKADGGSSISHYTKAYVKRYAKLTVNASPEPVTKGRTITVTGKLTRANWETHDYRGYTGQTAKLQFRKAGSSTYTTVKNVTTDSHGNLKANVTASADGYWRYVFAGTTTTGTATAAGDYVDVH